MQEYKASVLSNGQLIFCTAAGQVKYITLLFDTGARDSLCSEGSEVEPNLALCTLVRVGRGRIEVLNIVLVIVCGVKGGYQQCAVVFLDPAQSTAIAIGDDCSRLVIAFLDVNGARVSALPLYPESWCGQRSGRSVTHYAMHSV
jgi:hypothetical protein